MKPKFIAKRSVILLLAVVLLTGCLIPHAANNETAQEAGGITDPLISTTSNIDALPELSTDSTLLSEPESLAEAEAAYRERMQRECAEGILADSKIADYVNTDEFFETKPMFRLTALETLNSYVVQNADNTNTIYFMAENVKYVDDKGEIREKDIRLSATAKGFAVTDSDVKLLLPAKISDGISVNTDFGSITLAPLFRGDSTVILDEKSNSVRYDGAFGNGTFLRYTPTLSGVKEDIILETRPEENSFEFRMETQGLYLAEEDGIYYLVSTDNKDSRIRLNQIYIYDANGRFTAGEMSVIDEGRGKFLLTVAAPREFLDAAETTYPVTIDPSINVYTKQYSSNIIDAAVYQNKPNMNAGTWQYDNIGYTDSTYGLARTVIKLSALLSDSTYQSLTASQINSVTFSAMEATGNSSKTVKLHPITGSPTWTESTVTWNNYGSFDTTVNYGGTLTGDQRTSFNITNLVKAWKNGSYNGNGCFIFIMGGTENSQNRALYSMEYSTTGNRPYVTFSYTSILEIDDDYVDVEEADTYQLSVSVNPSGATITYSVDDTDIATVSSSGLVTGIKAGTTFVTVFGGGDCRLVVIYVLIEDGVYTFKSAQANKYLTVDGVIEEEYIVRQREQIYEGNPDYDKIRQMWKIKYLGYGKYSVRSVRMLYMGLSSFQSGNFTYVTTHYIRPNDYASSVDESEQWTISRPYSSSYIRLSQNGESSKTVQSISNTITNGTATVLAQSSGSLYALWLAQKVSIVPKGIYIYDTEKHQVVDNYSTEYVAPQEERNNFLPVGYSGSYIEQSFFWSSTDGFVSLNSALPNATIKGLESGVDCIQVRWNSPWSTIKTSFYVIVTAIPNGTYFIKNKQSGKYADINSQIMADNSNVHQWEFHGGDTQRWSFTRVDGEYYSIVSNNSTTAYYLGLENESNLNDNIVIRSSFLEASCKWKLEKKADGSFIIMTQKGTYNYELNGLLYVMSVASNNSGSNGGNIQQLLYTNDSDYRDEWSLLYTDRVLETPLIGQSTDCWCWVASAQMLSRTNFPTEANNGNSSTIEQEQRLAVYHVFGNSSSNGNNYDWNSDPQNLNSKSGIYSDVANASAFLTGLANGSKVYSGYIAPYEEDILIEFISDGYAVARLYGWTTCNVSMPSSFEDIIDILLTFNPQLGGHVTVISGVCWSSSRNCFLFKVLDPWSGGSIDWLTYSQLLFNANNNGNQYDITFWFPTAVTNTYYSDNTFMGTLFSEDYSS